MCFLFVYLHFMDCLHVLLSTLRLSLIFVPANHKQLSLPFIAWKSLEKVVVYKAASGKAVNQMASDWSWSHLNIGPALWLEVVPLWKTRGNLTVQNPSGRQPLAVGRGNWYPCSRPQLLSHSVVLNMCITTQVTLIFKVLKTIILNWPLILS